MAPPPSSKRAHKPARQDSRPAPATSGASAPAAADPLRAAAGTATTHRRDIIPIPVLIIVFLIVEVIIIVLMAPKFVNNWTSFDVRRRQQKADYKGAIPGMLELVREDPDNPTYLAELANAYMATKEYAKAIGFYQKAQQNRTNLPADDQGNAPEHPDFNNMIGMAYLNLNELDNAEKYLKLALQHNKLDKHANFAMGEVLFKRGKFRESGNYFKVVAQDPGYKARVQEYYSKIEKQLFANVK